MTEVSVRSDKRIRPKQGEVVHMYSPERRGAIVEKRVEPVEARGKIGDKAVVLNLGWGTTRALYKPFAQELADLLGKEVVILQRGKDISPRLGPDGKLFGLRGYQRGVQSPQTQLFFEENDVQLATASGEYSPLLINYATDMVRVLQERGNELSDVTLLGHSLGGLTQDIMRQLDTTGLIGAQIGLAEAGRNKDKLQPFSDLVWKFGVKTETLDEGTRKLTEALKSLNIKLAYRVLRHGFGTTLQFARNPGIVATEIQAIADVTLKNSSEEEKQHAIEVASMAFVLDEVFGADKLDDETKRHTVPGGHNDVITHPKEVALLVYRYLQLLGRIGDEPETAKAIAAQKEIEKSVSTQRNAEIVALLANVFKDEDNSSDTRAGHVQSRPVLRRGKTVVSLENARSRKGSSFGLKLTSMQEPSFDARPGLNLFRSSKIRSSTREIAEATDIKPEVDAGAILYAKARDRGIREEFIEDAARLDVATVSYTDDYNRYGAVCLPYHNLETKTAKMVQYLSSDKFSSGVMSQVEQARLISEANALLGQQTVQDALKEIRGQAVILERRKYSDGTYVDDNTYIVYTEDGEEASIVQLEPVVPLEPALA